MTIRAEWDTSRPFFEEFQRQVHKLGYPCTVPNKVECDVIIAGIQALEEQAYQRGRYNAGDQGAAA